MRTIGANTKKDCWNCIITDYNGFVILDKNYPSLKLIAEEIGMSLNQVSDRANGRFNKKSKRCRFDPIIKFNKLSCLE